MDMKWPITSHLELALSTLFPIQWLLTYTSSTVGLSIETPRSLVRANWSIFLTRV